MRIGIDISQIVHEGSGVARYVRNMVRSLLVADKENEYILFGASLRRRDEFSAYYHELKSRFPNVRIVIVPVPITVLEFVWNTLHIIPVDLLLGGVDVFWSSDWVQPPLAKARGVTTIHDLIALKYPDETQHATRLNTKAGTISADIVAVHKRRLAWVKKECSVILCDSLATKNDVKDLLGIPEDSLRVVYPGFSL